MNGIINNWFMLSVGISSYGCTRKVCNWRARKKRKRSSSSEGGGYSIYPWVGRCDLAPHTLTLFKTNITDFPTLFKTMAIFDTLFKTFKVAVTRSCVALLLCNQWKFNVPGINAKVNGSQY